ncbi:Crp/Fnr family transcriptional regulator [Pontibacter lucknowensis]|uniref:cAMP-binding domain of CRP or a regulatory subunit of cAMP-dependent protein kinases n=1 Tax=Pontibacter lucknowensis TaxID=1077936 RepID=A0A1N7AP41_9BACT|nr:Crp/Fnr family transcriptional regulator [Pontibacter lucknowensis]SIR40783.1 cAMP-binding domain of CRP or a regulatory subunit of cAMP-dependent protein kinases [Pontibacter lucknowensis]
MENEKAFVRHFFQAGVPQPEKLDIIAQHFHEKLIDKHDHLLSEGKISQEYLLLESGFMRAYSLDTEGDEVTTAFYGAGQPVFDVASFFMHTPAKESIQALAPCSGWVISFDDLNKLFHSIPEFREVGRGILVKGYASLKLRMQSMITETAETRYAMLLHSNPEIFRQAPLKHIASYLGITDSSLSRIRRDISRQHK